MNLDVVFSWKYLIQIRAGMGQRMIGKKDLDGLLHVHASKCMSKNVWFDSHFVVKWYIH